MCSASTYAARADCPGDLSRNWWVMLRVRALVNVSSVRDPSRNVRRFTVAA